MINFKKDNISILAAEDNEADAFLLESYLGDLPEINLDLQKDWASTFSQLEKKDYDLLLLDWNLPDASGEEALELLNENNITLPIIILTEIEDEKRSILSLKKGVQDYIVKSQINKKTLIKTIRYAYERYQLLNRLEKMSMKDELTGIYNRRFIEERGIYEFSRCSRYNSNLSCLLLDIDHFKSLNDNFGHDFGDAVLKQVATLLIEVSREVDLVGRYGGEEFLLILPETSIDQAKIFSTKVLKAVSKKEFIHEGLMQKITLSIGLSGYNKSLNSFSKLIKNADYALGKAKESGRNCIITFDSNHQDIKYYQNMSTITKRFQNLNRNLHSNFMEIASTILSWINQHDSFSKEHALKVCMYVSELSKYLNLSKPQIDTFVRASMLHDIGLFEMPHYLLSKTENLTTEEVSLIEQHVEHSVRPIKDIPILDRETQIIYHHHEHFDGSGYPNGVKGPSIPLGARILSIVDSFCAMIENRPYQQSMTIQSAIDQIKKGSDIQYDPEIVDKFIELITSQNNQQLKKSILIIDDDNNWRFILNKFLKNDYSLTNAENGMEAMGLLESKPFNLILLDLYLPGIDGFEILRRLQKIEIQKQARIIVITGKDISQEAQDKYCISCLLQKPIEKKELIDVINQQIQLPDISK